jgi:hypothetical protein
MPRQGRLLKLSLCSQRRPLVRPFRTVGLNSLGLTLLIFLEQRIEVHVPLGLCSPPRIHRREDHPVDGATTLRYCGHPRVSIPRIMYAPCV